MGRSELTISNFSRHCCRLRDQARRTKARRAWTIAGSPAWR